MAIEIFRAKHNQEWINNGVIPDDPQFSKPLISDETVVKAIKVKKITGFGWERIGHLFGCDGSTLSKRARKLQWQA